ncbi:MAG TPA: hypothetical protein VF528_14855 [Pyrinomonadaceae bacterium]
MGSDNEGTIIPLENRWANECNDGDDGKDERAARWPKQFAF